AGAFYPADPGRLRSAIERCYGHRLGPGRLPGRAAARLPGCAGFIVPHAGYAYSGPIAAHAYARAAALGQPEVAVILGPNHSGAGAALALSPWEAWETPLGTVAVHTALGDELAARVAGMRRDRSAHSQEHSLEVQLPFLVHAFGTRLPVLPIAIAAQDGETAAALGEGLAAVLAGRSALVFASSDLSHYLSDDQARRRDAATIDALRSMDPAVVAEASLSGEASLCGAGAVMALLAAARRLGIEGVDVLAYGTSGDTSGDRAWVVGYVAAQLGPTVV
ncbi:MAG: AmmeMemoRadiSam system protein B, partial [Gemmatimonadetes bacterium]|nr:AmmeMemoRadiSam system protein B [Gemmatimonadota bacterium]